MTEARRSVRARITGRVQGVSFRAWTRSEAEALGLDGWVRNEADGSVVALLSGPSEAVAEMLTRLHDGPRGARVSAVEAQEGADAPDSPGFAVLS